ncbi:MAG: C2 family cysteine protease, partial [Actinomycetota bacterium]
EYGEVPHELFIPGDDDGEAVHPNDADQGAIGDCWIMAAMTSVAQENPQIVEDMIQRNGHRRRASQRGWRADLRRVPLRRNRQGRR